MQKGSLRVKMGRDFLNFLEVGQLRGAGRAGWVTVVSLQPEKGVCSHTLGGEVKSLAGRIPAGWYEQPAS